MKSFVVLISFLALTACSDSDNKKNNNGANGPLVNNTDYSVCGNITPPGTDITSHKWHVAQSQNGLNFDIALQVSNGFIQMSNYCEMDGHQVAAHATARGNAANGVLKILTSAEKTEKLERGGVTMTCSIAIEVGTMNYTFKGKCLEMTMPGSNEKVLMAPY